MMRYMEDYPGDALSITDEQVAADWRMGLVRSAGRVMARSALPTDSMERFGMAVPGSNRAHIYGERSGATVTGTPGCKLVAIYEAEEDKGERYNFNTFGDNTDDVIELGAKADCACGRLKKHRVTMEVNPGELIYLLFNAENED